MEWMILPLKKYAQFSGRSRRKEFWMWILFIVIVSIVLSMIDSALGLGGYSRMGSQQMAPGATGFSYGAYTSGGVLTLLFSLAVLIPNLAVGVRRLHDTGRSGWWLGGFMIFYVAFTAYALTAGMSALSGGGSESSLATLSAVSLVCGLVILVWAVALLVFYCLEGTRGPNRFGPDPKNPEANLGEVFS